MKKIIELKNVTKSFGTRKVLDNIDIDINEGDLVTIMGESGSGKSTLLNILGCLDRPTSGEYFFYSKKIKNNRQESLIRNQNIGFVFQSYNLIPKLTAYENIVLPIYYSKVNNKQKNIWMDSVLTLMEQFNISNIANSYVELLSGGEKQRVCLARALVCDAKLIICDEPTGNLDEKNADVVINSLINVNENGKTVIIVTHDSSIENITNHRYFLEGGTVKKHEV